MMGIKDEDEDGIHSHMLLGKKKEGGLPPILVSRIESLLNFLKMNLCSILWNNFYAFLMTNKKTFYPAN